MQVKISTVRKKLRKRPCDIHCNQPATSLTHEFSRLPNFASAPYCVERKLILQMVGAGRVLGTEFHHTSKFMNVFFRSICIHVTLKISGNHAIRLLGNFELKDSINTRTLTAGSNFCFVYFNLQFFYFLLRQGTSPTTLTLIT